jgi:hypothetical protein
MDIAIILSKRFPNSHWSLDGDAYEGLTWLSDDSTPTEKELEALWPQVVAEIESERQAILDAKAKAISKLKALGLTVDEVQAAFGLKE